MSKPSVITVPNRIAGVEKITLASDLALNLAKDFKVLLIDLDPSGDIANADFIEDGIKLQESFVFETIKINSLKKNLSLLQGSKQLNTISDISTPFHERYKTVSKILSRSEFEVYDYIIIDCLSSWDYMTKSALVASDYVFIPLLSLRTNLILNFLEVIEKTMSEYIIYVKIYGLIANEENFNTYDLRNRKEELEEELYIPILDSCYSVEQLNIMHNELSKEHKKLIEPYKEPEAVTVICEEIRSKLGADPHAIKFSLNRGDNHE